MNYSRHRKAQAEREALLAKQSELKGLDGAVRAKAEAKIMDEAQVQEEVEVEAEESLTPAVEPKKRGRKPKAE